MQDQTDVETSAMQQVIRNTSITDDPDFVIPGSAALPDGLTVEIEGELFTIKDGKLVAVNDESEVSATMAAFLANLSRAQKRMPWFFSQGVRVSKNRACHTPHDLRKAKNRARNKVAKQARKVNR